MKVLVVSELSHNFPYSRCYILCLESNLFSSLFKVEYYNYCTVEANKSMNFTQFCLNNTVFESDVSPDKAVPRHCVCA